MSEILLKDVMKIEDLGDYNLHLACWNEYDHPLDIFLKDEKLYQSWQEWRDVRKNRFPRKYIMSFAQVYNENLNIYLFTGIYEIISRHKDKYEVKKTEKFSEFIGRLKIKLKTPGRGAAFVLRNHFEKIKVNEILSDPLVCEVFKGCSNINLKFTQLETIIKKEVKNWKNILSNTQGVYLLFDDKTGRYYVGSATASGGIWQRWSNYINNYTGNNKGLIELLGKVDFDYFKQNFRFILLDYFSDKTDEKYILERESFWKIVLKSREFGNYNCN